MKIISRAFPLPASIPWEAGTAGEGSTLRTAVAIKPAEVSDGACHHGTAALGRSTQLVFVVLTAALVQLHEELGRLVVVPSFDPCVGVQ